MPIRVLCVFSTLDRGGAESMCMNLYRNIDRSKVQFDFVKHTAEKGGFEDEILSLGGKIYEAPRYKIVNHMQYEIWWKTHLLEHPEHKIIHGHFFTISSVYMKIAKEYGRITIGHSHCTPSDVKSLKEIITNYYVSKIYKYSDYRMACSQPAGEWVFKSKPFMVLNNAIDVEKFAYDPAIRNEARKEFALDSSFVVGTVGRIMHQKNPIGIIDIFAEVHKRNTKAKLLWVGEGMMRAEAEAHIHKLNLQDSVIMTGVRSDVNRLMQAMDAFIFPSFFEGLGIVAVEAQAAGLPTYCSDSVPREAGVTSLCKFLSISDYVKWAEEIISMQPERYDTHNEIVTAGYDIHDTAKWLTDFYINAVKR